MKTTFRILPICLTLCATLSLISCDDEPRAKRETMIASITPSSGVTGTEIVIRGDNLQDPRAIDTKVFFNGIQADVVSISEEEIVTIVPNFASTGDITLVYEKANSPDEVIAGSFVVPLSGSVDLEFNRDGQGPDLAPNVIKIDDQGRIIIAGFMQQVNGTSRKFIARLHPDGTLDESFNTEAPSSGAYVRDFDIASDGSIVAIGSFEYRDGNLIPYLSDIARILPNGSHDKTTLKGYGPVNGTLHTVAIQSDGKILLGGEFTSFHHVTGGLPIVTTDISRNRIIRLNEDFTVDESFDPGTGFNNLVTDIQVTNDGDIMVIGAFNTYNGQPANGMILLDETGNVNNTFSAGSGFSPGIIHKAIELPNDKWVVSGTFTEYQGTSAQGIVQLLPNGDRNTAFALEIIPTTNSGSLDVPGVTSMHVDNGRIALGGLFTVDNDSRTNLIVINFEGTLLSFDSGTTFKEESGGTGAPKTLAFEETGNLLVSAYKSFTYNNEIKKHLFKVMTE